MALTKLKQFLLRLQNGWQKHDSNSQPLVDDLDRQRLQQFARSNLNHPLTAERDVQQLLLGERLSAFTGRGYEFAENRLFQFGDDARFINWRLYARTGQLYCKIFHEERRPQLWLVVDRRSSMRFATRRRLKVTAAVRQALVHLYQAQQQQIAVGAVLLDNPLQWFEARTAPAAQQTLINSMNHACPPLHDDIDHFSMDKVVRQLHSRLQAGSIVIILSDFHDLEQKHIAHLHQLAQQHTVIAVQVLDDIELKLPLKGRYRIEQSHDNDPLVMDCTDTAYKNTIEQQLQFRRQQIEQWLLSTGVTYQRVLTSDEPFSFSTENAHASAE